MIIIWLQQGKNYHALCKRLQLCKQIMCFFHDTGMVLFFSILSKKVDCKRKEQELDACVKIN